VVLLALLLPAGAAAAERVHEPVVRAVPKPRGTVVLVHAGGWSGPDQRRQWDLDWWPGRMLRAARWNTVAIDYAKGRDGLSSVASQLQAALINSPNGRVCAYGESSGAHLALLAAAGLPALRCVIGLGTPTDLDGWREEAISAGNAEWLTHYMQTADRAFGPGPVDDRWEPVAAAPRIAARVLLAGQADDHVLPVHRQMDAFAAVHPATEQFVADAGAQPYLHGTISAASRARFAARMRAFLRRG
jgi:acetyl esterase/lipase